MASRPGQVTLHYEANKFPTVAANTLMDCAWRVRPANESDTPGVARLLRFVLRAQSTTSYYIP